MKTKDAPRKAWFLGHTARAEIRAHDAKGKPVLLLRMRRYKTPIQIEGILLRRSKNKIYLLQLGHDPQLSLWKWRNDPLGDIWIGLGENYKRLEEHDLKCLMAVYIDLVLPNYPQNCPRHRTEGVRIRLPKAVFKKLKQRQPWRKDNRIYLNPQFVKLYLALKKRYKWNEKRKSRR